MKATHPAIAGLVVFLLLAVSFLQNNSYANDLGTLLIPDRNIAEGDFIGVVNIELRYPEDSSIANVLNGVNERYNFAIKGKAGDSPEVDSALTAFNRAMIEANSPVQVTKMDLTYTVKMTGNDKSALISYKIQAKPTLEKFVLARGEGGQSGHVLDLEWRKFAVTEPIMLSVQDERIKGSQLDLSKPIGLMKAVYPELATQLESSGAREIFELPILHFDSFDIPMERWHFLFDPTGSLVESSAYFREESGAKVVSIYSLGESSFREGTFEPEEKDIPVTIDGAQVLVHSQVPAPSGQISIAGFSKIEKTGETGEDEVAVVTADAPAGFSTATGGFPIQVLLIFGGMMGAIAIFILFRAKK